MPIWHRAGSVKPKRQWRGRRLEMFLAGGSVRWPRGRWKRRSGQACLRLVARAVAAVNAGGVKSRIRQSTRVRLHLGLLIARERHQK